MTFTKGGQREYVSKYIAHSYLLNISKSDLSPLSTLHYLVAMPAAAATLVVVMVSAAFVVVMVSAAVFAVVAAATASFAAQVVQHVLNLIVCSLAVFQHDACEL